MRYLGGPLMNTLMTEWSMGVVLLSPCTMWVSNTLGNPQILKEYENKNKFKGKIQNAKTAKQNVFLAHHDKAMADESGQG